MGYEAEMVWGAGSECLRREGEKKSFCTFTQKGDDWVCRGFELNQADPGEGLNL